MLKTSISNISRIIENVADFNFQYFQDRKNLILNRGPYNINFRTELMKSRGPNRKIYRFLYKIPHFYPLWGGYCSLNLADPVL